MKIFLILLLFYSLFSCTTDSSSENNVNIFTGDVNLFTQEEVESFGSNDYTEIVGDLNIGDPDFLTDISSLESLSALEEVGNLSISVDDLTSLNGLNNLTSINGDFYIRSTGEMDDFNGLDSLNEINGNFIVTRSLFENLSGLENLAIVNGNLEISSGYSLNSLEGFQLSIIGGDFKIVNCDLLIDLSGIETLTELNGNLYVQANDELGSLVGLQNLITVDDVIIGGQSLFGWNAPNQLLADFCDLTNLFTNGAFGEVIIIHNLYNPSFNDIINGNCSL